MFLITGLNTAMLMMLWVDEDKQFLSKKGMLYHRYAAHNSNTMPVSAWFNFTIDKTPNR
jgi:hypothetical protein